MRKEIEYSEIKLKLGGMLFTWDDEKEESNIHKHGIEFEAAAAVFFDVDAVIRFNSIDDETGEERFDVTGMAWPGMLFVVYVERVTSNDDDIIRIISARRATKGERKNYDNGLK